MWILLRFLSSSAFWEDVGVLTLGLTEGKTVRGRMGVCRNGLLFTAHLPQHRGWRQTPQSEELRTRGHL